MRLAKISEDFDKAVGIARRFKDMLDATLVRTPATDAESKLFILSNIIHNNQDMLYGDNTPQEITAIFNMLGQAYGVDEHELRTSVSQRQTDVIDAANRNRKELQAYTPVDWLRNYAKRSNIPWTFRDVPTKSEPKTSDAPTSGSAPQSRPEKSESRNYRKRLTEALYGYRVGPGNQPIDQLLNAVDNLYIDFDPNNPKFQKLVARIMGRLPEPGEWAYLIQNSSQSPELKQRLLPLVKRAAAVEPAAGAGGSKATIIMKRGTIINADHVVIVQSKHSTTGYYILAGIGPTNGPTRVSVSSTRSKGFSKHPDFNSYHTGPHPSSSDPHKTAWYITPKFKKIMSIVPHNISEIRWSNGTVQKF